MHLIIHSRTEGARRVLCAPPARESCARPIQTFHVWLPSSRRAAAILKPVQMIDVTPQEW